MSKITIGMVGLGDIAHQFAQNFNAKDAELYGCASRHFEKAKEFQEQFNLKKAYHSYDEMLDDDTLDAVYIAVPNRQHFAYARLALIAGKHVLCEKAITVNDSELATLVELAADNGLILQEAMTIFNMPLFAALKKNSDDKLYGDLKMIQAPFGSYKEPDPTNRFFNPALGGGALLDIGTYAVSLVRYFYDEQPELVATSMVPFSTGVDEQSVTIFKDSQNILATVPLSFQARTPKMATLSFEKAYVTIDEYPRADQAVVHYNDGRTETLSVGDTQNAMNYEVDNFVAAIKTGNNLSLPLSQDVIALLSAMNREWHKK